MSFKSKREIKQSEDKWIVVENTHEPLISEQLRNDAHLIYKIVVGDRIKVDDGYYQKVSIHYKFIGELE